MTAIAVAAADQRALALQTDGPATIIDTRTLVATGTIAAPADATGAVDDAADDAFIVYETGYDPRTSLTAYRARDGRRLYSLRLHLSGTQSIQAVAVDPRARTVYVLVPDASLAAGQLIVLDGRTGRRRRVVPLAATPLGLIAVDPATGHVYIPAAEDTLLEYRGERGRAADEGTWPTGVARAIPLHGTPTDIVADGTTDRVFVADGPGSHVAVFDGASGAALAVLPAGDGPRALTLDGPDHRLYVADKAAGVVTVLDTRTGRTLRRWTVGGRRTRSW